MMEQLRGDADETRRRMDRQTENSWRTERRTEELETQHVSEVTVWSVGVHSCVMTLILRGSLSAHCLWTRGHQSEEAVGDHMICRRQKHSECYRVGQEKEKVPQ